MASTEDLTFAYTTVGELVELLPTIPSTHAEDMRIIIHMGAFDILWKKTGSEILKKDFFLLLERLCHYGVNRVSISGTIPTMGKGSELFSQLLSLNTWLSVTCIANGIKVHR